MDWAQLSPSLYVNGFCLQQKDFFWTYLLLKSLNAGTNSSPLVCLGVCLGPFVTLTVMKLSVTTGIIPSLNVAVSLLGFFFKFPGHFSSQPFTRQESTVVQTCVAAAASGIAFSSGYGSYILGMTKVVADQGPAMANTANNVVTLDLGWMLCFSALVSFVGLFAVLPLRKVMILDYKLTYPSGTATGYLINSFHTPQGAKLADKQVKTLFKWFGGSFAWGFFQWLLSTAASDGCGFAYLPGLKTVAQRSYFASTTYVGVGMMSPHSVNLSMLLGSVVSWGIIWPLIEQQEGKWYSAGLNASSLSGLQGYKVSIVIAMILGDGLFQLVLVLSKTLYNIIKTMRKSNVDVIPANISSKPAMSYDDQRRTEYFLKDQIPLCVGAAFYVVLAIISSIAVPIIFPSLKFYHITIIYIVAPVLAFCNSYGCGLSDWSFASHYGKLAIFIFGSWVGLNNGGIIAGLAACGITMGIVSTASDLMQDFKTGYLTLASPRSMFFSQMIGTSVAVITSPVMFWYFIREPFPNLGQPDSSHPAPLAKLYRGIALIASEGVSALPNNCLMLSIGFFSFAVFLNMVKQVMMHSNIKAHKYVPSATAMAIPFYLGGYYAINMCVGSLYRFWREWNDKAEADAFVPAVASGIICGDSLCGIPASIILWNCNHVVPAASVS
ncbi:hypothetical protein MKW94_023834 [Papaver nudicaule]|uniref:Metal-nicotianamine transporter YSL7 n=1 Tax=Papaver nudicaule TaxID=74823 RepID=A0AA41VTI1_PAPNU|nr:hypothetical protein [Papaver nudicaule]